MDESVSRLHIIVPTCGNPALLGPFCRTLAEHTPPSSMYFIFNEDGDKCRAIDALRPLRDAGHEVHLYDYPERIGYVRACNIGWKLADPECADYVAVLNDDVVFDGRWYEPLRDVLGGGVFQAGPSVKWVGLDGFWGVGDGRERYVYCEGWCFLGLADGFDLAAIGGIDTRKDVLFDPAFEPAFCEDQDLSIRIQEYAGQIAEVDIPVRHLHSQTIANNATKEAYFAKNRKLIQSKWHLANPQWGVDKA